MKNLSKKLSREEMKKVTGGVNYTLWLCRDNINQPFGAHNCTNTDPAPVCGFYSDCMNTGTACSPFNICD